MLSRAHAHQLFCQALSEFAPDWTPATETDEVTVHVPHHWLSGIGTFGVMLQHRATGARKILGRRDGGGPGATYHRGISFLILEAYAERNTDPILRYLQEIGAAPPARSLTALRTA
jgi:hypothetical protein